jgi:hypothetical protein
MKEKGIKGKAGSNNKEYTGNRREFNAFREMAKAKGKSTASGEQAKPEIWLEFMGTKIRVHDEEGGTIKDEEVPHIKGAALKFEGCGGELHFNDIKVRCTLLCLRICSQSRRTHYGKDFRGPRSSNTPAATIMGLSASTGRFPKKTSPLSKKT